MTLWKITVTHIVATVWIIFSVVYIWYDQWRDLKNILLVDAYTNWKTFTVNALFNEIKKADCKQPITVSLDDKSVSLIDIECLQNAQSSADADKVENVEEKSKVEEAKEPAKVKK